jgi:hypothetical protein
MLPFAFAMLAYLRPYLISRHNLALEVAALRQQLAIYKRRRSRPRLNPFDRFF